VREFRKQIGESPLVPGVGDPGLRLPRERACEWLASGSVAFDIAERILLSEIARACQLEKDVRPIPENGAAIQHMYRPTSVYHMIRTELAIPCHRCTASHNKDRYMRTSRFDP
jgi:hypothetical protein